jgi:hypothetical protein
LVRTVQNGRADIHWHGDPLVMVARTLLGASDAGNCSVCSLILARMPPKFYLEKLRWGINHVASA